jgi:hypothetical protein
MTGAAPTGVSSAAPVASVSTAVSLAEWAERPVPRAFALGWQIAELYRAGFHARRPWPPPPERLPGIGRLAKDQRLGLGINQLTVTLARLAPAESLGGLEPLTTKRLRQLFDAAATPPADGHAAFYELHVQTLQTLSATDFRLGKAYSLGRALADLVFMPAEPHDFRERFGRFRLDVLRAWLNDLASALPPHSAGAVLQSLTRWEAWAPNFAAARPTNSFDDGERPKLAAVLGRQGELWRAVLSGEKNAQDMLNADDYRRAARTLLGGARRSFARSSAPFFIAAFVLTAAIIAAVLLLVTAGAARTVTAIGVAAGALGITWKSASAVLQRASKALEQPLWGAALNAAIAEAVTYLPPDDADKDRLLKQTPTCLRVVDRVGAGPLADTIATLRGRRRARGRVALRDAIELSWWRVRRRSPSEAQVRYWLTWARAAGYLTADDDTYSLTEEGHRLARIPPREHDATRAALSASRPSAQTEASPGRGEEVPDAAPARPPAGESNPSPGG